MLETIANQIIENWDTQVVGPLIVFAAVYSFYISERKYFEDVKKINEKNEQMYREEQRARRD